MTVIFIFFDIYTSFSKMMKIQCYYASLLYSVHSLTKLTKVSFEPCQNKSTEH